MDYSFTVKVWLLLTRTVFHQSPIGVNFKNQKRVLIYFCTIQTTLVRRNLGLQKLGIRSLIVVGRNLNTIKIVMSHQNPIFIALYVTI